MDREIPAPIVSFDPKVGNNLLEEEVREKGLRNCSNCLLQDGEFKYIFCRSVIYNKKNEVNAVVVGLQQGIFG